MTIEPMTTETVAQVAALEAAAFSTPWSEASIRAELDNEWALWLVALEGPALAGWSAQWDALSCTISFLNMPPSLTSGLHL